MTEDCSSEQRCPKSNWNGTIRTSRNCGIQWTFEIDDELRNETSWKITKDSLYFSKHTVDKDEDPDYRFVQDLRAVNEHVIASHPVVQILGTVFHGA
ncbi:unnamed protein product [Bubo scandiacus]